MAGSSMAFTYDNGVDGQGNSCGIRKVTCDWVSDSATGSATGTTTRIVGRLIKIVTDPGATAPTDNWDVVLTDDEGVDLSGNMDDAAIAALLARDTANTEETYLCLFDTAAGTSRVAAFPVICGELTVTVNNAGNSKNGQIIIYYDPR